MTTDFPTAPPAYGLEGPSAGSTVEKSPSASHTKILTLPDGTEFAHAHGIAWLEERVAQWPEAWGSKLRVLIYGDFRPPTQTMHFPHLGITISPEHQPNTVVKDALTVLEATVTVNDRSVNALIDASRRVNLLLGAYVLNTWCNTSCGWWSWFTHEGAGGALGRLDAEALEPVIAAALRFSTPIRRKVDAALFWLRQPRRSIFSSPHDDILRRYSAYWNAFECLVDAVVLLRPRSTQTSTDKQTQIDEYIRTHGGSLTAAQVQECYQTIVNPGFVGKATYALSACFNDDAARYIDECFRRSPAADRLYNIRNAINHGDVDAENPVELSRISARLGQLTLVLLAMFGRVVPFAYPVDRSVERT